MVYTVRVGYVPFHPCNEMPDIVKETEFSFAMLAWIIRSKIGQPMIWVFIKVVHHNRSRETSEDRNMSHSFRSAKAKALSQGLSS